MKIDTFFVWYTFCRNATRRISTELVIYKLATNQSPTSFVP